MNKPELWLAAAAAAPLLSYFLGRFNRWAGLGAGLALFCFPVLALSGQLPAGPFLVLALWTAAALAHSVALNGRAGRRADRSGLDAALKKIAALEKELAAIKEKSLLSASEEKRSLAVYSAVKLLSETVDPQAAGRQLGKYLADYFAAEETALYLAGNTAGEMELFAQGAAAAALPALPALLAAAGGLPQAQLSVLGCVLTPVLAGAQSAEQGSQAPGLLVCKARGDADAEAAVRFAAEISFALKRVQLFKQVEWLSLTDGLTGLWRRNALDEKIREEMRRSSAFKTSMGFMIVDIDHFKRLNDNYGHQFGDAVLKRVAQLLKDGVYETDFVGRYGGEEFGIVLPRADAAGVLRKAETIRARMAAEVFSQGLETVRLTVSIGIAHFPRDGRTPAEVIAKADAALYAAKESGRNKVLDAGSVR
ncbi:MAG TPA: GGDEF domain-containing protein [Elusimicrobiales bacterium]|nr:GGDEF domain-containing protein [Elusimicrobiales bacterium]